MSPNQRDVPQPWQALADSNPAVAIVEQQTDAASSLASSGTRIVDVSSNVLQGQSATSNGVDSLGREEEGPPYSLSKRLRFIESPDHGPRPIPVSVKRDLSLIGITQQVCELCDMIKHILSTSFSHVLVCSLIDRM
jgi:hypothetical protein